CVTSSPPSSSPPEPPHSLTEIAMTNDTPIDLDTPLPSRWPTPGVQPFAPTLKLIRDRVRADLGPAYKAGFITGRVVEQAVKAVALDFLAGQIGEVDGRAYARAVQSLVVHLIIDDEG